MGLTTRLTWIAHTIKESVILGVFRAHSSALKSIFILSVNILARQDLVLDSAHTLQQNHARVPCRSRRSMPRKLGLNQVEAENVTTNVFGNSGVNPGCTVLRRPFFQLDMFPFSKCLSISVYNNKYRGFGCGKLQT